MLRVKLATTLVLAAPLLTAQSPEAFAKSYSELIRKSNEDHARKPGKITEADLKQRLSRQASPSLSALLKLKESPALSGALMTSGEAALDLDLLEDFEQIRARLEKVSPELSRKLGIALSRPRFVLRGLGGVEIELLEGFADMLDSILSAYEEVFGFKEWSKVPGKKLRVRIHLEPRIERPPHFAPEHPYHSEIDFPVVNAKVFSSPTKEGQFLFYGLCHELGHVIAMWGNAKLEEDHHAWAHYTGLAIVDHLSTKAKDEPWMKSISDSRWRSLSAARKEIAGKAPSLKDRDGVLSLLLALHDTVGTRGIGDAINSLDAIDKRLRINRVRYYTFDELKTGLLATQKAARTKQEVKTLIESAAAGR